MDDLLRGMAAVALWTAAGALMIAGTIWGQIELMAWGGFVALTACCVTYWIIAVCTMRHERVRVDAVVQATVDRLRADAPPVGVARLPER